MFGSVVTVAVAIGAGFASFGLWLVLPFVGLEVVAVGAAFLLFARHATDFERIVLADGSLSIERHDGGRCRRWRFVAAWTRVELEARGAHPAAGMRLVLASGGERVEVGRHGSDRQRATLARELRGALRSLAAAR